MTEREFETQVSLYGRGEIEKYSLSCRRVSRISLIILTLLILILQVMTFFVALNGGYDGQKSLILALIPVLGPLVGGFQLMFAGVGSPLVLFSLFVPCLFTLIYAAYYHDEYAKSSRVLGRYCLQKQEAPEFAINPQSVPVGTTVASPRPAVCNIKEFPTAEPIQEAPLTQPAIVSPKVQPEAVSVIYEKQPERLQTSSGKTFALTKAEEEYQKALDGILSLLNKNKS